jgi:hypothetical protein
VILLISAFGVAGITDMNHNLIRVTLKKKKKPQKSSKLVHFPLEE